VCVCVCVCVCVWVCVYVCVCVCVCVCGGLGPSEARPRRPRVLLLALIPQAHRARLVEPAAQRHLGCTAERREAKLAAAGRWGCLL